MQFEFPQLQHFPITQFHQDIFTWWRQHGRILPWREKVVVSGQGELTSEDLNPTYTLTSNISVREHHFSRYFASSLQRDPYKVVVAEMMLQQTQVERVLQKYHDWLQKWPKINNLASSDMSEVLVLWQGLGYNRRAKFLWQLARAITYERQDVWPTTEKELLNLPGIGQYTARAVMSFALGQQVGVVDTNIQRVLGRVVLGLPVPAWPLKPKDFFALADRVLPAGQADPWNQAIMDLGALVCTARSPKCQNCPVASICQANQQAQAKGFANFAEWLKVQVAVPSQSKKPPIKFEETNRYFRGRIMDELRLESPRLLKQFLLELEEKYGLSIERAQKLLAQLDKEEMLKLTTTSVKLGG
jgi:A/G-specific adenine glycosylase